MKSGSAWTQEKEIIGRKLVTLAYESNCVETVFNTADPEKRRNGWILKNGMNSIYFINFRNAPGDAEFITELGYAMGKVAIEEIPEAERDWFIGVEMAGVPLIGAMPTATYLREGVKLRCGYTRPFTTEKIRTVEKVLEELSLLRENLERLGRWGSHRLVEADYKDGQHLVTTDDMVTNAESKLIAQEIIDFDAKQRGFNVYQNHVLVGFDREQGATEALGKLDKVLHYVVPMKKGIFWLEDAMHPDQFEHLKQFIEDPSLYQDIGRDPTVDRDKGQSSPLMQDALDLAAKVA